jgi:hypothetical protein
LLVSCFPMFVVSCEMRPASQLDSKLVGTGKPPERKDDVALGETFDACTPTEVSILLQALVETAVGKPLLAESDYAENIRRRQPQQLYVENCSVVALHPFSQLRAVQLDPAR